MSWDMLLVKANISFSPLGFNSHYTKYFTPRYIHVHTCTHPNCFPETKSHSQSTSHSKAMSSLPYIHMLPIAPEAKATMASHMCSGVENYDIYLLTHKETNNISVICVCMPDLEVDKYFSQSLLMCKEEWNH